MGSKNQKQHPPKDGHQTLINVRRQVLAPQHGSAGAQRVAEKIKKQIMGGSLNRDELIAEAQEFIALFKEHPMFKEIVDKISGFMGPGGLAEMFSSGSSASAPSERRRAVQERLRKKMAERNKDKSDKESKGSKP